MEAIADMDSFDRLDLSENRYLRVSFWQCNFFFPNKKDYFVAKCNHIVKSNNKWLWLNNFRLARLAAPLLAAALNKVFKIVLLNSHQGHNLRKSWFISFLLKVTISENHDWLFSQGWRGDRHQMWSCSRSADGCVGRGEITKKVVLIKIRKSKNPKSKIQNTKKVVLIKIRATLPMSFLICDMNINKFQDKGVLHRRKQHRMFAQEASWRLGKVMFYFLSKINNAKMFGGIVKKQNSSQRSEQNKTSRWIINIFLLQHHFGQVQQDKEKHSKKNVSELRVSTKYHPLNFISWFDRTAVLDKL